MIINKKTINTLITIIYILLVILLSGTPFTTIYTSIGYLIIPFGFLAFLILFFLSGVFKINKKNIFFILLIIMICLTAVVNLEIINFFHIKLLMTIFFSYYLCKKYSKQNISKFIVDFMFWITLISLPLYFINNYIFPLSFLPVFTNINDVSYGVGIVFNYLIQNPERNCAIFWEPGIFASYISIALFLHILSDEKKNRKIKFFVFLLGIISAHSSAGYVLCLMCLLLLFYKKMDNKLNMKMIFSIIFTLVVVVLLIGYEEILKITGLINNPYVEKLLMDNIMTSSRFEALIANFIVFINNPIFGAGIVDVNENLVLCGDMATSTYLLSIYGILGMLFTVLILTGIFSQKKINICSKIIVFSIIICIVNKEPHILMPFIWFFIFYLNENKNIFSINKKEVVNDN